MAEYVANSGTKKYMEHYILCVKDAYSKRGIATRLCEMYGECCQLVRGDLNASLVNRQDP